MAIKVHILTACVFVILSATTIKANHAEILLQNLTGDTLFKEKKVDSIAQLKKVCSCRLVEVRSDSYDKQLVGIFAEKTIKGRTSLNYKILRYYIEREKSFYKFVFLETLRKQRMYSNKSSCHELYRELKLKHRNLVMYNIIDVDALKNLVKR